MNRIDIQSREYPALLKQIKDPPGILYFKGDWDPDIFTETLSVVGSRRMTVYGETMTDEVISAVAAAGITIVSGFMYGIDARAHGAALKAGGRTIAVMPCGIDRIHPEYQEALHARIISSRGLVVSEYPEDTPPALWTYPRRNRIIAGLSPVLLVVEAGLKSGALITAKIAARYGKNIFSVPGPLTSLVSQGTALLIKQGAKILINAEDILLEYGKSSADNPLFGADTGTLCESHRAILELLSREPLGIDQIARVLGRQTPGVGADLTVLSLKKRIVLKEMKYYLEREA